MNVLEQHTSFSKQVLCNANKIKTSDVSKQYHLSHGYTRENLIK